MLDGRLRALRARADGPSSAAGGGSGRGGSAAPSSAGASRGALGMPHRAQTQTSTPQTSTPQTSRPQISRQAGLCDSRLGPALVRPGGRRCAAARGTARGAACADAGVRREGPRRRRGAPGARSLREHWREQRCSLSGARRPWRRPAAHRGPAGPAGLRRGCRRCWAGHRRGHRAPADDGRRRAHRGGGAVRRCIRLRFGCLCDLCCNHNPALTPILTLTWPKP